MCKKVMPEPCIKTRIANELFIPLLGSFVPANSYLDSHLGVIWYM